VANPMLLKGYIVFIEDGTFWPYIYYMSLLFLNFLNIF
jgi:hypothetical protein